MAIIYVGKHDEIPSIETVPRKEAMKVAREFRYFAQNLRTDEIGKRDALTRL